jgi:hypothetical protein
MIIHHTEIKEEEQELTNVIPIKRSLVGLDGGIIPPGTDWLSELPEGTEFLCKMAEGLAQQPPGQAQMPRFVLQIGTVLKHLERARYVRLSDGNQQVQSIFVDPKAFCKVFEKFAVINNDDDSEQLTIAEQLDRSNQPE